MITLNLPIEATGIDSICPFTNLSASGNVDWFDFWLNDHEDPAAEKSEQYARWRQLRGMRGMRD